MQIFVNNIICIVECMLNDKSQKVFLCIFKSHFIYALRLRMCVPQRILVGHHDNLAFIYEV